MSNNQESFNKDLYDLLKVRGYKPVPLNMKNERIPVSQDADVIQFNFIKDGTDFGQVWVTIDNSQNLILYYDEEQQESPSDTTPGTEYDDTWTGFLKHLKNWAQRRQLSFELANKDRLGDDMRQRDYYKMKEKLGESYHPMGKKASYSDAVPNVKIILQHNRALGEGEQRYRNVAKIFLENQEGERFLAPTTRPGIARIYARHIAEGGVPNDERWNHIKGLCEEYNKMAGFVRATRNGQFNESAQELVNEGINHYNNLRETLHKLASHRGYQNYFESWTPTLMEDDGEDLSEMFMSNSMDPRIESAMPILSRLHKKVSEMKEINSLAEWADSVINEKLELEDQQVNELSTTTLKSYKKKADKQYDAIAGGGEGEVHPRDFMGPGNTMDKRAKGINMATKKLDKSVDEAREMTPSLRAAQKNLIDLASGEVKRREAEKRAAAKSEKEWQKTQARWAREDEKERQAKKKDVNTIWRHVEHAISNYFPDGDPTDYLGPYMEKNGLNWDDITNAAKKHGYSDLWDYWNTLAQDIEHDAYGDWLATGGKNVRQRAPFMEEELDEDLGPEQKRVGQLGPTEKVRNNNIGKLVGASESKETDPELARIIEMAKFKS